MAFVYLVDTAARTPIYHDRYGVRADSEGHVYLLTRCHQRVHRWDAVLREEHAELFSRPCKHCWPNA